MKNIKKNILKNNKTLNKTYPIYKKNIINFNYSYKNIIFFYFRS